MSKHVLRGKTLSAFMQGGFLIALSIVLAAAVNIVRPDGLDLPGNWDASVTAGMQNPEVALVGLDDAWSLYTQDKIAFVDAREPFVYEQGHLSGALNVPVQNAEKHLEQLQSLVKAGIVLVTYCDSPDCPLSYELAMQLKTQGIYPVRVLKQGWIGWYEAGFPSECGLAE